LSELSRFAQHLLMIGPSSGAPFIKGQSFLPKPLMLL